MRELLEMVRKMNYAWGHRKQNVPKLMDPYEVQQFTQSMLAYADEITDMERKGNLTASSELLSEMLLFLLSYVDRKGLSGVFKKIVEVNCYDIITSIEKNKKDKPVIIELEDGTVLNAPDNKTAREQIDKLITNYIRQQTRCD